jgi:hypothetical protein
MGILRLFRVYFGAVRLLLPVSRGVLGTVGALLALGSAPGCGDDFADPIVRVAPGGGAAGSNALNADGGPSGDLCAPCSSHSDCQADETCIALNRGDDRFCSRPCGMGNPHCPQGYMCNTVNNMSGQQCVPQSGDCNSNVY